jgi:hypothetical protein
MIKTIWKILTFMFLSSLVLLYGCADRGRGPAVNAQEESGENGDMLNTSGQDSPNAARTQSGQQGLPDNIAVPAESAWTDGGDTVVAAGQFGDWDYYLWGGFAGTAVKKGSTFFLYYQGCRDYSDTYGTVTYRAIGLATSTDGINFTKYAGSPVVAWFPNDWLEEGAASGGAAISSSGEVVMYFGANTRQSADLVNADARMAVSSDGYDFTDQGIAIDHTDNSVWGYGDELFPVITYNTGSLWAVYYIPNGSAQRAKLGVVWGPKRDSLINSGPALSGSSNIDAWGMGACVRISADTLALFVNDVRQKQMRVYKLHENFPDRLTGPVQTYGFSGFAQGTVVLDSDTEKWFMYYRMDGQNAYGVKTAPVTAADTSTTGLERP